MRKKEYIRTKDGYIGRIVKDSYSLKWDLDNTMVNYENDKKPPFLAKPETIKTYIMDTNFAFGDEPDRIDVLDVVKSSNDILDLLRVGDLLLIDIAFDKHGGIVVPRIAETQAELNKFVDYMKNGIWVLKGVLCYEQIKERIYILDGGK